MNAEPMAVVVGRNAKAIRLSAGVTLAEVAKSAKFYGLPWTTGRVGAFESGRVNPTLPTLFAVTDLLGGVTGRPLSLVDLFAGDGRAQITDKLTLDLATVRAALTGQPVQSTVSDRAGGEKELAELLTTSAQQVAKQLSGLRIKLNMGEVHAAGDLLTDFSDADFKVAKSLNVNRLVAAVGMSKLWGQTFVAERDQRAGPAANAQHKGRIARDLKDDLRRWLDGNYR